MGSARHTVDAVALTTRAAVAVAAAAVLLLGCGGPDRLSHAAFVDATNQLCGRLVSITVPDDFSKLPEGKRAEVIQAGASARLKWINAYLALRPERESDRKLLEVLEDGQRSISEAAKRNDLDAARDRSKALGERLKVVAAGDLGCLNQGG